MTLRSELARIISGQKAPEPVTKIIGGGSEENRYARLGWDDTTDPRAKIRQWIQRYRRGGPYADAIDSYPLYALTNGYKLQCEPGQEGLRDRVQEWCDQPHVDLDAIMWQGILSAALAGDAYQEVVMNRGGDVWGVVTRDPSSFRKIFDSSGKIIEYRQYPGNTYDVPGVKGIPVPVEIIINLMIFRLPGDMYGISLWERADDDIQRDCDVIESVTKAIHRHGTPKQQWSIGTPDSPASDADMKAVEREITTIGAKTDFVTSNTEITMLDTTGVANVDTYSNVSLQRVSCALGVPEEMLGLGRGSTEATATVRMNSFLDKISTIQEIVSRTYSRGLIDRITGVPGAVWIEFNDVSPEDEGKKAAWISLLRQGMDPDAICPAAWAREQFGIPPDEELPEPAEKEIDPDQTKLPTGVPT